MNKICVYTCITGNYDNLNTFKKEKGIDYICYTNNKNIKSDFWNVKYIEDDSLSNVKLARKIKILGTEELKKYDITLWIDGSVSFETSIKKFIDEFVDLEKYDLVSCKHTYRSNTYQELEKCFETKKETLENILKINEKYKQEKFEDVIPLIESGIIFRNFNNKNLMKTMNIWFDMIVNYSHRDQLSFGYSVWKNNINVNLLNINQYDNKYFKMSNHSGIDDINLVYVYGKSETDVFDLKTVKEVSYKIENGKINLKLKKDKQNDLIKIYINCKDNEAYLLKNFNKEWKYFNILVHNDDILLNNKSFIIVENINDDLNIDLNISGYKLIDIISQINEENNLAINNLNQKIINLNSELIEKEKELNNLRGKFKSKIIKTIKKIKK